MLHLNFKPFPELATARLVLTQLRPADADEIFKLRSDEEVNKYIDRKRAGSVEEAGHFIQNILELISRGESLYWAIRLKNDPALVGTICLWNLVEEKQSAEIGYELLTSFQGKGMMMEAIESVINYGFEMMQLERITAFTHQYHKNSIRLLEKNNFRRIEDPEQETPGDDKHYLLYTLTRPVQ